MKIGWIERFHAINEPGEIEKYFKNLKNGVSLKNSKWKYAQNLNCLELEIIFYLLLEKNRDKKI